MVKTIDDKITTTEQALDHLIIKLGAKVGKKQYSKAFVVEYGGEKFEIRNQQCLIAYANTVREKT